MLSKILHHTDQQGVTNTAADQTSSYRAGNKTMATKV